MPDLDKSDHNEVDWAVDELITELARPILVLRYARPYEQSNTPRGVGARKRAKNARAEIREIVTKWVNENV